MMKYLYITILLSLHQGDLEVQKSDLTGRYICECEIQSTFGIRDVKYELELHVNERYKLREYRFNRKKSFYEKGEMLSFSLSTGKWTFDDSAVVLADSLQFIKVVNTNGKLKLKGIGHCSQNMFVKKKKYRGREKL